MAQHNTEKVRSFKTLSSDPSRTAQRKFVAKLFTRMNLEANRFNVHIESVVSLTRGTTYTHRHDPDNSI